MQRPETIYNGKNNWNSQEQYATARNNMQQPEKMCNSKKQAMARNNVQRSETGKEQYATVNNTKKR